MIAVTDPYDGYTDPSLPGTFTTATSSGTTATATPSGSTTGLSPTGTPKAVKILFFRTGLNAEKLGVDRWSYAGPFARPELQAGVFNDTGIFHPVPEGVFVLDLADGEVVRWAESADPGALVDSIDVQTTAEDLHQATAGMRVTRKVIEPFFPYLRAIIIGPAAGILSGVRALGDYDHPPSTITAGRLITVVK